MQINIYLNIFHKLAIYNIKTTKQFAFSHLNYIIMKFIYEVFLMKKTTYVVQSLNLIK